MSRKLQAEIERVFKKVAEGIEEFEDCYDKVLNASNASQKEKYETDLKKEIKKLQRLRDQIKTWIQSNEIKDKQDLLHHRKLIEKQMEKFKAIEKEMKTKAYSKEGLLQSTRLDPKEKEKLDLCNWLVESVDSLSTQIDVLEATAETIEGSMGKKRRDPNKVEKLGALHERVERHKFHIRCLERIQRLLENESLSTEQVQQIQEDVNYYVEQNSDEEFVEDEFIYDELPLDEDDALFAIPGEDDAFNIDGDGSSIDDDDDDNDDDDDDDDDNDDDDDVVEDEDDYLSDGPEPSTAGRSVSSSKNSRSGRMSSGVATGALSTATTSPIFTTSPTSTTTTTTAAAAAAATSSITIVPHHQPTTLPPAPVERKNAWAEVKGSVLSPSRPNTTTGTAHTQPPPPSSALAQPWAAIAGQNVVPSSSSANAAISAAQKHADALAKSGAITSAAFASGENKETEDTLVSQLQSANALGAKPPQEQQALENESHSTTGKAMPEPEAQRDSISIATSTSADVATTAKPTISRASASPVGTKRPSGDEQQQQQPAMQRPKYFTLFQDSEVPDAFADLMATFMKAKHRFSAKQENVHNLQRQMVDMSLQGIPSLLDQERPKAARQTQVNTPSYYPQTALPVIEHPGMAAHLDLDTLFFAFYYQPNTYQQYLAAKELNRQSWRFHKKYLTWFQRYEEPSDITDDYEQGTYIYFDYEGAWCQRKKSEFRFGYQFLEDTELA
ncbi:general negative regulator of transcription subunit 5 [Coemansia sp. RSA 1358]|uniref:General negative regulator of transcription subunit n=1 Tax=Coemansia umbellata TaxID=1424467 RepID=A0ABQ8PIR5_9FUNG|nr:general negative regulator of transcription subunit 5 [Coemansia umbellata]KAJ2622148.1 general negative regulator of transcription subunit 5 [Coemansia sp. RSA 1358]